MPAIDTDGGGNVVKSVAKPGRHALGWVHFEPVDHVDRVQDGHAIADEIEAARKE